MTDDFAAEAKATLPPGVAGHLHARTLAGASPILGHSAIGRANARGGLTLVINPYGYAMDGSPQALMEATEVMFSCLFTYHAGYQIKELLLESYEHERTFQNVAAGLRVRADHAAFGAHPEARRPDQPPTLLGLTRAEAFESLGNRCFPLFLFTRPRFGFRRSEQRLLSHALRGGTNEDCAQALGVSLSAVKKRWEAIYARVAAIDPALVDPPPAIPVNPAPPQSARGVEKKGHILAYLRQHPEELRPHQP